MTVLNKVKRAILFIAFDHLWHPRYRRDCIWPLSGRYGFGQSIIKSRRHQFQCVPILFGELVIAVEFGILGPFVHHGYALFERFLCRVQQQAIIPSIIRFISLINQGLSPKFGTFQRGVFLTYNYLDEICPYLDSNKWTRSISTHHNWSGSPLKNLLDTFLIQNGENNILILKNKDYHRGSYFSRFFS